MMLCDSNPGREVINVLCWLTGNERFFSAPLAVFYLCDGGFYW